MNAQREIALVVEAPGPLAVMFKIAAQIEGLRPIWARTADEAIRYLRENEAPRLVIIGVTDVEQLSVLRALRIGTNVRSTRAIVCASLPALRERVWAERAELGISQLIAIPATIRAAQHAIQEALTSGGTLPRLVVSEQPLMRATPPDRVPPRQALEEVAREVAQAFSADVAFVLIEGRPKDSVHAGVLPLQLSILSEWSPVRHVIDARSPLIAIDGHGDLFDGDPIAERLGLHSFAGVPLVTSSDHTIGMLGILDAGRLSMGARDLGSLVAFARRLTGEVELLAAFDDATRAADRLASSLSQVQTVVDHLDDGILLLDRKRCVVSTNPAFARFFDPPPSGWLETSFDDFVAAQSPVIEKALSVRPDGVYAFTETIQVDHPIRRILKWSAKPIWLGGEPHQLHLIKDITLETDLLREKQRLSLTDALTGLGNRRASEEAVVREVARSDREHHRLAIVLVDVDLFKRVNDLAGHSVGDRVLEAIGRAIERTARRSDLAFRWGGEEFLVLLPQNDLGGARTFGERLRSEVEKLTFEGWEEPITISVGTAEIQGSRAQDAFLEADRRLYEAKKAGRNRVH